MSKTSKIVLGIFFLSLAVLPFSFESSFSLIMGIFVLVASVFFVNDVKKLNNSTRSKILSVILINTTLYSTAFLFYAMGASIDSTDGALTLLLIAFIYTVLLVVSIILGVILVVRNKNNSTQGNPNRILSLILLPVLIILFYTPLVSATARITHNTTLCSMHFEIKDHSFIFGKGVKDSCIWRVALDTSNATYCKQIKDTYVADPVNSLKNSCLVNIARNSKNVSVCYQISNDDQRQKDCIRYVAELSSDMALCETPGVDRDQCYSGIARGNREIGNGNPEICNYITDNEEKYWCYSIIAIDKRDTSICEKYFPSDEILISEGVNPSSYSKKECTKDAIHGSFN